MAKKQIDLPEISIFKKGKKSQHGGYLGRFDMVKETDNLSKRPVEDQIQYKCIKCGECCRRGFSIELSIDEMNYLAKKHPEIKSIYAYKEGGSVTPFFNTGPKCSMLANDECSIFKHRPFECHYYPFTLEEVDAHTPGALEFGRKYYKLYVYEDCKGLGEGEVWSPRKTKSFINRILRENSERGSMLTRTYQTLTTEEFFRDHIQYGSGVIYGTEKELQDFLVDYKTKLREDE
jgi:Fe-S-cluster containining protein